MLASGISVRVMLAAASLAIIVSGAAMAAHADAPKPPLPPDRLELSVDRASTNVTASWSEVPDATSYQVRWRHRKTDFAPEHLLNTTAAEATFDVGKQGAWVVRVEACNDAGCGRGTKKTARVIINITGHAAVRFWYDHADEKMRLDWDALAGRYVVKYRAAGNPQWRTSDPLEEAGYAIAFEDLANVLQGRELIIRVFFNCDANGNRCDLLGRIPDLDSEGHKEPPVITHNPLAPGGVTGASEPVVEIDPITHQMRPGLTVTTEVIEDNEYRCVSRPTENAWERAMFGPIAKSCHGTVTTDRYKLDPDAEFPGGARCGARPAENDEERATYGKQVKVCNAVTPSEIDSSDDDPDGDQVSGSSHRYGHRADRYIPVDGWPDDIAQPGGGLHGCRSATYTKWNYYSGTAFLTGDGYFPTSITVDWCYRWRHRIDAFQTIRATTWQPPKYYFDVAGVRLPYP